MSEATEKTLWSEEKTEVTDGKTVHTLAKETVGADGISILHTEMQKTYIDKDGHEHTEVKSKTKPV